MNSKIQKLLPDEEGNSGQLIREPGFLSSVTEQVSDAIIVTDRNYRISFINQATEQLYGYPRSALIGQTPDFLNAEPLAEAIQRDIYKTVSSRHVWKGAHLNKRKDGSLFLAEMKVSPMINADGLITSFICLIRDISEIQKARDELHASRQMLQLVLDNIPQRIFWKDRQCVYLGCNKTFAEDAGISEPQTIIGKTDYDLPWKEKEADLYREVDRRVMENDRSELYIHETQRTAKRGDIWLLTNKVPLHNTKGEVIGVLGTYEDITLKKRAEEALRESEEKYRTLVGSAGDAIFLADIETGYLIDANKKAEELLGLPVEKIIGMHYTELHPRDEGQYHKNIFRIHTNGNSDSRQTGFVQHRSGRRIPVHISGGLCELNGRKVIIGIFRDITELKLVEESLRRDKTGLEQMVGRTREVLESTRKQLDDARRLAEIGALAAMVAHELRNPLGVIRTALYNIRQKRKTEAIDKHIDNIDKKISESEKIIHELLNFAQIKIPRYEKVVVSKALREVLEQCRQRYPNHHVKVKIKRQGLRSDAKLEADPVHLNELFMNILDNAFQSIVGQQGTLEIHIDYDKKDNSCRMTFRDSGEGIPPESLPHIFDPFYTTRVKGTGLGLSICSQLVNLHNGRLDISSQKGRGTMVTLELPIKGKR